MGLFSPNTRFEKGGIPRISQDPGCLWPTSCTHYIVLYISGGWLDLRDHQQILVAFLQDHGRDTPKEEEELLLGIHRRSLLFVAVEAPGACKFLWPLLSRCLFVIFGDIVFRLNVL